MPKSLDSNTNPSAPTEEAPANGQESVISYKPPRRLKGPASGGAPRVRKRTFWQKLLLTLEIGAVIFIILIAIGGYFAYEKGLYYFAKAQTVDLKKLDDLSVTSTFYDVNGEELGRIFVEDRIVLTPEQIPATMRQAVMAAEDRRFYEHGAIDYWGILRALRQDLQKHSHGVQAAARSSSNWPSISSAISPARWIASFSRPSSRSASRKR